ncbi:hypothetical protein EW145_g7125 [Phellinidium pouzarii]|uniref:Protein kinase domain-containing protein n=1 Tax=Phellinidium pouzarii TaxID=167371 RepID=A0A4S4KPM9_9AGAM|nr:hypothetical protein EW145_g7125 [Phellinidium pouzarii]
MWARTLTASSRRPSEQERELGSRQLSLRRLSCRTHQQRLRLLAEIYCGHNSDAYDDLSADTLVLCIEENQVLVDAVENRVLDQFGIDGELQQERQRHVENEVIQLVEAAIPSIERFYVTATRITIRTVAASENRLSPHLTYTFSEESELIFPFSDLPRKFASLGTPTALISSLTRVGPAGRFGLAAGVDRVRWQEHTGVFAFKRADRDVDVTTGEIEILMHTTPHEENAADLLQLHAIVVDAHGRLRGFLARYEPYGSLEEVFTNRRIQLQSESDPVDENYVGSAVFPHHPDWKMKLTWGAQLARGLAVLHSRDDSVGPLTLRNLNPRNVLVHSFLNPADTRLIIAGLRGAASPTGLRFPARWSAPERVRRPTYALGPELDVANLGMVLWALAEERFDGFPGTSSLIRRGSAAVEISKSRDDTKASLWQSNFTTPGWYKLLVESCIEEEASCRPNAVDVATVLERELKNL